MGISSISQTVKAAGLSSGNALAEAAQKGTLIHENDVTAILMQRWIACYMLYDWNPHHAGSAYLGNKCDWVQQTYKRLDGTAIDAASLNDVLTDTFNRILLEDVEDFIQTHMKVWKCDRLTVEFQVAKAIAEIYPGQKP